MGDNREENLGFTSMEKRVGSLVYVRRASLTLKPDSKRAEIEIDACF